MEDYEGTVGWGLDYHFENNLFFRITANVNFYDLKIKPFELQFDYMTMAILRDSNKRFRFSYLNMLFLPAAIFPGLILGIGGDGFFGFGPIGFLFIVPQALGNVKLHLPLITEHLALFAGLSTDYFTYDNKLTVCSEGKAGMKGIIGKISAEVGLSKPFVNKYIENKDAVIYGQLGIYLSRKYLEKNATELKQNPSYWPK